MDREEALGLLNAKLEDYRKMSYADLVTRIGDEEVVEVTGASGTEYQIEVHVTWDQKPNGDLRVMGTIDKVGRGYLDTDWDDECNSADQRGYCADNEDLAEGDIGKSILAMREVLEREGVVFEAVEDDFGRQGYDVIINGQASLGKDMQDEGSYVCDSCGEEIVIPLDLSAGSSQRYVEDCPVCCCPNVIQVEIDEEGNIQAWAERE